MSASDFEDYTTGRTILFADGFNPFGAEQYLPDRKVIWSDLEGDCINGTWYMEGPEICFAYEGFENPQCWSFYRASHGLWARFMSDDSGFVLYESGQTTDPLQCRAPGLGV